MTRNTFSKPCFCAALFCAALFCAPAVSAQGLNNPKITNIPGGFFIEWVVPVEIAAVHLKKNLTGPFEVMFDLPSVGSVAELTAGKSTAPSPDMVMLLTDYWIVRGKPERAVPMYENCIKQGDLDEAKSFLFHNNLAMLYSQEIGDHEKALAVVNSALETRRDNMTLLDTKGLILINGGNAAEAVPVLQRAVELSCERPIYCMHLSYACYLDNRHTMARQFLEKVRAQLIEMAPTMTKENKAMFDTLQLNMPPVGGQ